MARKLIGLCLALVVVSVSIGTVSAHDGQHGPLDGHLIGSGAFGPVELVGKVAVHDAADDRVADVAALGDYAYLAAYIQPDCAGPEGGGPDGGVYVIDISDPSNPLEVGFIPAHQDTFVGEGVQALHIDTSEFNGDVLVQNNEGCGKNYKAGASLWDITDPLKPKKLFENYGDFTAPDGVNNTPHDANQIHSAFAWDAGSAAYMVMVDDEEANDVDILDISNPKKPVLIAEYDLNVYDVAQPSIGLTDSFLHDMVVKEIGGSFIMLLSYWDGGYIKLDVTDPANAVFLGDTDFTNPDPQVMENLGYAVTPEGNGHQAEFTADNQFIVASDEDFNPYGLVFEITTGANAGAYPAGFFSWTVPIDSLPDGVLNGPTIYGGYGCPLGDAALIPPASSLGTLDPGEEAILVLSRGPVGDPAANFDSCFFSEKVEQAQLKGYGGVVIANHHAGAGAGATPDATLCGSQGHAFTPTIPGICIGHRAFHLLFNTAPAYDLPYLPGTEPAIGALGEDISAVLQFNGWGYIHLFDNATLAELDTFAIPEAMDPAYAFGFGALSNHEVATDPTDPDLVYLSYYAGGFRVLQIQQTGPSTWELVEIGGYLDPLGNELWGVQVWTDPSTGIEYILASDMDSGLWIFRYTGG